MNNSRWDGLWIGLGIVIAVIIWAVTVDSIEHRREEEAFFESQIELRRSLNQEWQELADELQWKLLTMPWRDRDTDNPASPKEPTE